MDLSWREGNGILPDDRSIGRPMMATECERGVGKRSEEEGERQAGE